MHTFFGLVLFSVHVCSIVLNPDQETVFTAFIVWSLHVASVQSRSLSHHLLCIDVVILNFQIKNKTKYSDSGHPPTAIRISQIIDPAANGKLHKPKHSRLTSQVAHPLCQC